MGLKYKVGDVKKEYRITLERPKTSDASTYEPLPLAGTTSVLKVERNGEKALEILDADAGKVKLVTAAGAFTVVGVWDAWVVVSGLPDGQVAQFGPFEFEVEAGPV